MDKLSIKCVQPVSLAGINMCTEVFFAQQVSVNEVGWCISNFYSTTFSHVMHNSYALYSICKLWAFTHNPQSLLLLLFINIVTKNNATTQEECV